MRPPRVAVLVFFLAASFFLLCRSVTRVRVASPLYAHPVLAKKPEADKSVWRFMYYNTPFSLFPPNAAISVTDDNSTSFAARPAAFGPKLALRGLSGQLWVGHGFAEATSDTDGELGCSDLPGWEGNLLSTLSQKSSLSWTASVTQVGNSKRSADKTERLSREARSRHTKESSEDNDRDLHEAWESSTVRHDTSLSSHADSHPVHGSTEIKGKIVLLMRGGCGFLEKVLWAQRRGAIAVIIGDNQKGGPLIQMFAHGQEVDNVTIPSVFTARTTAHLLSSLAQPGSFIEDIMDDNGDSFIKVQQRAKRHKDTMAHKNSKASETARRGRPRGNFFLRLFGRSRFSRTVAVKRGLQSGKKVERALVDDWNALKSRARSNRISKSKDSKDDYEAQTHKEVGSKHLKVPVPNIEPNENNKGPDIIPIIFGLNEDDETEGTIAADEYDYETPTIQEEPTLEPHDGLWLTITPTNNASPFFDTLLVLVISPLVTLTVVYALLILRARIRRRRWRAPKSVVERLPVRTYHTVAASPSPSTRQPSPSSSSPSTPLLQQESFVPRPRSRTTTGVPDEPDAPLAGLGVPVPRSSSRNRSREHEKGAGGFSAEWRKYMGRQVECVVCLEEYVDGVSQVMSLPCGHEFHADCITPWLTTRRRTCPICKGDVVRSLARGSPSRPRYEPYQDDSDEEEGQASGSRSREAESDLEQGVLSEEAQEARSSRQEGWLNMWSNSFGTRSRGRSPPPENRDR